MGVSGVEYRIAGPQKRQLEIAEHKVWRPLSGLGVRVSAGVRFLVVRVRVSESYCLSLWQL